MTKDILGKEIKIKDIVTYATRDSCHAYLNVGIVRKFYENNKIGLNILRTKKYKDSKWTSEYKKENIFNGDELIISKGTFSSGEILILPDNFLAEIEKKLLLDSLCT